MHYQNLAQSGHLPGGGDLSRELFPGLRWPGGSVTSNAATLTVTRVAPAITTQPVSTTVLQNAASPSFTVVATGSAPLAYQWQLNSGSGFANIGGATSATYASAGTAYPANNGNQYRVIVSNDGTVDGSGTDVTSNAATLTVTQTIFAPTSLTGPTSLSLLEGAAVNFSVTVNDGTSPFTYQWQRKQGSGAFTNISGATNAIIRQAQPNRPTAATSSASSSAIRRVRSRARRQR